MIINKMQSGGSTVIGMNLPGAEAAQMSNLAVPVVDSSLVPPVSWSRGAGRWFRVLQLHCVNRDYLSLFNLSHHNQCTDSELKE